MKRLVVIICTVYLVLCEIPKKVTYNGNQLWKVSNSNNALNILAKLQDLNYLEIWGLNVNKTDIMVNAPFLNKVNETLLKNGLDFKIKIENIQEAIDTENPKPQLEDDTRKGYRLTWDYYHSINDIYDYLSYLEHNFPKLCSVISIGRSVEGRRIKLLRISNRNPNNKAIFIEGGIHAREWISPASVTYVIQKIITNYGKEPQFIKNIDWYFVPILNPDGYEHSYNFERLWRKNRSKSELKNCIGVDLNRNFGYDWSKNGSSTDPCSIAYRGRKPFSEPETAAVANFFINSPKINWAAYIAVHSYGQFIVYPWGSQTAVLDDHEEMNQIALEAANNIIVAGGEAYQVGPAGLVIYSASGISMDWAKGSQGIKNSFTIELRDKGHYGYILPAKLIKITSDEALITIKTIAKNVKV